MTIVTMTCEIKIGATFDSYDSFLATLEEYSKKEFVQFYKRTCMKLETAGKRKKRVAYINKDLKYYSLKMCCIYGGREFAKKKMCKNIKRTKTFKQHCPVFIQCIVSGCGQFLVISKMELVHNHPVSEQVFKRLPQQRRLPKEIREKVAALLKMNVDRKSLKENLKQNLGKFVTSKDLVNIMNNYKSSSNHSNTAEADNFWTGGFDACLSQETPNDCLQKTTNTGLCFQSLEKQNVLSYNEKFQQISAITEKINEVVSHCSGKEFERNKKLLEDILKIFKASVNSGLPVGDETSNDSHEASDSQQCSEETTLPNCSQGQCSEQVQNCSTIQLSQSAERATKVQVLQRVNIIGDLRKHEKEKQTMGNQKIVLLSFK